MGSMTLSDYFDRKRAILIPRSAVGGGTVQVFVEQQAALDQLELEWRAQELLENASRAVRWAKEAAK